MSQEVISHNITNSIRNFSSDYYCQEHNTSYPTLKSLKADHPDLDESQFTRIDKREVTGKLHTEKLSEGI